MNPIRIQSTPGSAAPATQSPTGRFPGQLSLAQAEVEARAKIMWGEPPQEVIGFLIMHGYGAEAAKALLAEMLDDRAQTIRQNGLHKIFVGVGMMSVPIVAFIIFQVIGVIPLKIFGLTLAVGAWGLWRTVSGFIMFLSPRSEAGDLADQ